LPENVARNRRLEQENGGPLLPNLKTHAFATESYEDALRYAERAAKHLGGQPVVYRVEPVDTSSTIRDIDAPDDSSWMSPKGFKVISLEESAKTGAQRPRIPVNPVASAVGTSSGASGTVRPRIPLITVPSAIGTSSGASATSSIVGSTSQVDRFRISFGSSAKSAVSQSRIDEINETLAGIGIEKYTVGFRGIGGKELGKRVSGLDVARVTPAIVAGNESPVAFGLPRIGNAHQLHTDYADQRVIDFFKSEGIEIPSDQWKKISTTLHFGTRIFGEEDRNMAGVAMHEFGHALTNAAGVQNHSSAFNKLAGHLTSLSAHVRANTSRTHGVGTFVHNGSSFIDQPVPFKALKQSISNSLSDYLVARAEEEARADTVANTTLLSKTIGGRLRKIGEPLRISTYAKFGRFSEAYTGSMARFISTDESSIKQESTFLEDSIVKALRSHTDTIGMSEENFAQHLQSILLPAEEKAQAAYLGSLGSAAENAGEVADEIRPFLEQNLKKLKAFYTGSVGEEGASSRIAKYTSRILSSIDARIGTAVTFENAETAETLVTRTIGPELKGILSSLTGGISAEAPAAGKAVGKAVQSGVMSRKTLDALVESAAHAASVIAGRKAGV
jgi:hypothetical protein